MDASDLTRIRRSVALARGSTKLQDDHSDSWLTTRRYGTTAIQHNGAIIKPCCPPELPLAFTLTIGSAPAPCIPLNGTLFIGGSGYIDLGDGIQMPFTDASFNTVLAPTVICYGSGITSVSYTGSEIRSAVFVGTTLIAFRSIVLTGNPGALVSIDVTGLVALVSLIVDNNSTLSTILGLASCTALTSLSCSNCTILSIDISGSLSALTVLNCSSVNVYGLLNPRGLTSLTCRSSGLSGELNFVGLPLLTYLDCGDNSITRLHLDTNLSLQTLICDCNVGLTNIYDLSSLTALSVLNFSGCNIGGGVNLAPLTGLTSIRCDNNAGLTSLSGLTACTGLLLLSCTACGLSTLVLNNPALTDLYCSNNSALQSIVGLQNSTALQHLNTSYDTCVVFHLSDLSGLTHLETLCLNYCADLSGAIDALRLTVLSTLSCNNTGVCALTGLGPSLTVLSCASTALRSLNLTTLTNLTSLNCSDNAFTGAGPVGLNSCRKLTNLFCGAADISGTLDLSGFYSLQHLECPSNRITKIIGLQDASGLSGTVDLHANRFSVMNAETICTDIGLSGALGPDSYANPGIVNFSGNMPSLTSVSGTLLTELNMSPGSSWTVQT